jgi:uncharacterized cupredoxin-like copper-binding protein
MRSATLPAVAVCTVLAVLSGCEGKKAPAADANLLRVVAADFKFDAPETIPGGVTTVRLVDQGATFHHLQLVRLDQGKTVADLVEAMKSPGPLPGWATMVGGPNAAMPGDSTTAVLSLDPGTYGMLCLIPGPTGAPHFAMGMTHQLTVTGPVAAAVEPAADDTIKLVDYDFQYTRALSAGHHVIRVENGGEQAHELVVVKLNEGKTAADFAAWADKQDGPPPAEGKGGVTGILPGAHNLIVVDLPPGNYALVCFFPDMKDGKPHLLHGMMKAMTVS